MEISLVEAGLYAFDRLSLAILIGCGAAGIWLIVDTTQRSTVANTLRRLTTIALLLLTVTTISVLLFRTASMADVSITETAPYLSKVINQSAFGSLWIGRAVMILLLSVAWWLLRKEYSLRAAVLMFTAGAITALCISGASHAGDEGLLTFDNLINTTHIVAGCLWGGAIIAYLVMLITLRRYNSTTIAASVERLSIVATVAVALIVITGLINCWNRFEALSELWSSGYGITLIIKLAFVAAMTAIGFINRFHITPAIAGNREGASLQLQRILYIDTLLFITVIACAAALGMQSPEH